MNIRLLRAAAPVFAIPGATLVSVLAVGLFATAVVAQDLNTGVGTLDRNSAEKVFPAKPLYSPYAGRKFPTRPFFGDTHLHTAASFDAGAFGARLGAREAYRFARGEEVMASSGQPATLSRPWISSSSPITRTKWGSSRTYLPASRSSWPTRRARSGTT